MPRHEHALCTAAEVQAHCFPCRSHLLACPLTCMQPLSVLTCYIACPAALPCAPALMRLRTMPKRAQSSNTSPTSTRDSCSACSNTQNRHCNQQFVHKKIENSHLPNLHQRLVQRLQQKSTHRTGTVSNSLFTERLTPNTSPTCTSDSCSACSRCEHGGNRQQAI